MTIGDKYIRYSKYGGVTKDTIKAIKTVFTIDTVNAVNYRKLFIINSKGIEYDANEIFIIDREYTPEQCENIENSIKVLKSRKTEAKKKIALRTEQLKETLLNKQKYETDNERGV